MKLLAKFNVIFSTAFALGLIASGIVAYFQLKSNAREQVVANARIMMQTALAMRSYTTQQIQPMIKENWERLDQFFVKLHIGIQQLSSTSTSEQGQEFRQVATQILEAGKMKLKEVSDGVFYPQSVPAFAATESFTYLKKDYPEYNYKEATLNPTNPRDLAEDWEKAIIERFRADDKLTEETGDRDYQGTPSVYLARPIRITNQACLTCHTTPELAPIAMVKRYGRENGFGWKMNEVIGAQVVSVPTSLPEAMARKAFTTLMIALAVVFVATLIALNIVLRFSVVDPVRSLSSMADSVSKGDLSAPEVQLDGKDEISLLSASFNRMRRSLEKALKMLE